MPRKNSAQRYEKEMRSYEKILLKYRQYLKLERSLSENTVEAYLTDLDKLLAYLTLEGIDITDVTLQDLENFSAGLHDIGIHPRSQARILSGIRSFFRFLPRPQRIARIAPDRQAFARCADRGRDRRPYRSHRPNHSRRATQPDDTGDLV